MNRIWIGIGLLIALLAAGIWSTAAMDEAYSDIADTLRASAEAAQANRWEEADALAEKAGAQWEREWPLSAALTDHAILDEIDGLLAQMDTYRAQREVSHFAALCAHLASQTEALAESHNLSWRNLL